MRLGIGLISLILLVSLFPFVGNEATSASPDRLKWSIVDTPSEEGKVVVSPSEINAFALGPDDETFYVTDIPHGKVYRSTDGGFTWDDDLTAALEDAGATLPAWDIAVAPDDPELVAVVTDQRQEVYVSEDGGESWESVNVPDLGVLLIADIAISAGYDGDRAIAVGTRNPDGLTNGDILVVALGGLGGWKAQGLNMDVSSVAFSPAYGEDGVILAIASDTTGTYLCTRYKVGDEWKDVIAPVEILESGSSPKESEIIVSDLTVASIYYPKDTEWVVYVAYYSTTEADDAYRIEHEAQEEDARVTRLDIKDGEKVSLASINYGYGGLLAGEVRSEENSAYAAIHICFDPEDDFPVWEKPGEPPTGGVASGCANAQVAWSCDGEKVYCGTSTNYVESAADWADTNLPGAWSGNTFDQPDESAFSQSKDDGDTWNQTSLIDTNMGKLSDYVLSVDTEDTGISYHLYLASLGSGFDSIWRSTSDPLGETWQRILCFESVGNEEIILRLTPDESPKEAIFFAVTDSDDVRYSLDKGEKWTSIWDCPYITDLAVVSNEMFYILDDNLVHKCSWNKEMWEGIWEWERDIETGLLHGYAIAAGGEDYVFVTGDEDAEGKVAYSTDGGVTFELTEAVPEPGEMQMIPDEELDRNRLIYLASSEGKIYRWTIGSSTSWKDLLPPHWGFYGLAQTGGALYGIYGSGLARTLIPRQGTVTPGDWDSLTVGLEGYDVVFKPGSLKATSDEAIDLWAIDDRAYDFEAGIGCLWVYSDIFIRYTPWPTSPAIGGFIPCDACECQASGFCFRWRELPFTEEYELWIALDEEFTQTIARVDNIAPYYLSNPVWCPPTGSALFVCGETFYWKVRASKSTEGEAIRSRWSPPMYFAVKMGSSVDHMHIAPVLKAPENGSREVSVSPSFCWTGFRDTTKYEFILAKDAGLKEIIVQEELPTSAYQYNGKLDKGTTYFWLVRATQPLPSEPAIGTFTVVSETSPITPATLVKPPPASTPYWIWLVIGILALLIMVIIVLGLARR